MALSRRSLPQVTSINKSMMHKSTELDTSRTKGTQPAFMEQQKAAGSRKGHHVYSERLSNHLRAPAVPDFRAMARLLKPLFSEPAEPQAQFSGTA